MKREERPFHIERTDEPPVARGGLMLAYEMAKALKLPQVAKAWFSPSDIPIATFGLTETARQSLCARAYG
ncbi:MAG: hypothetical protein HY531_00225 [Chloroflexi bacterium]|nr:hypothetical protein [Chloroflexota bacterium]